MEAARAIQQLHESKLDGREIYVREVKLNQYGSVISVNRIIRIWLLLIVMQKVLNIMIMGTANQDHDRNLVIEELIVEIDVIVALEDIILDRDHDLIPQKDIGIEMINTIMIGMKEGGMIEVF